MTGAAKFAKGTGAQFVYERLREEILSLVLAPDENLDEARLVARFGLSRTPVREALIRLAADGLVTMLPNRGAQVAALGLMDFPRYVEALDLLQRAVTRLAALRHDAHDLARLRTAEAAFESFLARDRDDAERTVLRVLITYWLRVNRYVDPARVRG